MINPYVWSKEPKYRSALKTNFGVKLYLYLSLVWPGKSLLEYCFDRALKSPPSPLPFPPRAGSKVGLAAVVMALYWNRQNIHKIKKTLFSVFLSAPDLIYSCEWFGHWYNKQLAMDILRLFFEWRFLYSNSAYVLWLLGFSMQYIYWQYPWLPTCDVRVWYPEQDDGH